MNMIAILLIFIEILVAWPDVASANQIFNIKASPYDASGSITTIRCDIEANNDTLVCPNGTGDFAVGQPVVIPAAGVRPSISSLDGVTLETISNGGVPTAGANTVDTVDTVAAPANTEDSADITLPGPDTAFTPATMAGIAPGMVLTIGSGSNQENVKVHTVTAANFTAPTTKAHRQINGPFVIRGYAVSLTPQSMVDIFPGAALVVDTGVNAENVTVIGIAKESFTAAYKKTHKPPFIINGRSVYCYAAAVVQGTPNGPLTAATAPVCIEQAIQTPSAGSLRTFPGIYTKITVPKITDPLKDSIGYALWKQVQGGPWHLYSYSSANGIEDQGYGPIAQMQNFNFGDVGLPDMPPSEPVSNDVFATVAALNGNNITLGPRREIPRQFGSRTTFPSLPLTSLKSASILHDDTPSLRAAFDYLRDLPPGEQKTIIVPCGDYNLWQEDPNGWVGVIDIIGLANVAIQGQGPCSFFHVRDARQISGAFNASQSGYYEYQPRKVAGAYGGTHFSALATTALMDPALEGSTEVRLADQTSTASFKVGDAVAIGIECGVAAASCHGKYPGGRYSETNFVTSVDQMKNSIGLRYPLNKTYSNSPIYTDKRCPNHGINCAGLPVIVDDDQVSTDGAKGFIVAHDITFRDLRISVPFLFWWANSDYNMKFENLSIDAYMLNNQVAERGVTWQNNQLIVEGADSGGGFDTATNGSADILVKNNDVIESSGGQSCTEGSVNVRYVDNRITITGFSVTANGTGNIVLEGGGYCDKFVVEKNIIVVKKTNQLAIFGRDDIGQVGIDVHDNILITDSLARGPSYKGSLVNWTLAHSVYGNWHNNTEVDLQAMPGR